MAPAVRVHRLAFPSWTGAPWARWAAVALLTLAALGLRLFRLGTWSFWIDEVYTVQRALAFTWGHPTLTNVSGVLTSLLLQTLPPTEANARLIPLVIGVASLPLLYVGLRAILGDGPALLMVLFLAISPWHLGWSQNARFYTALLLFNSLSLGCVYLGLERDRPALLLAAWGLFGLAVLERMIAFFILPTVAAYVLGLWLLPELRPVGWTRRNLLILAVPLGLGALAEAVRVLLLGGAPIYAKFVEIFVGYQMAPLRVLLAMVAEMGLPLFLLGLGGAALLVWRRERRGLFLALATVIPLAALVAISPWVMVVSRYVFPVLPFWALLAGYAIWELGRAVPGQTALLVWVVLALVVSESLSRDLLYFTYQNGDRQDWKGAFAVVTARAAPDDAVYTTRTEIGAWYLARPIDWTEGLTPAAITAAGRRAWFVVDDRTGHLSPEMAAWLGADTRLVSVNDVTLPGKPMFLRVYLYDPRLPPLTP